MTCSLRKKGKMPSIFDLRLFLNASVHFYVYKSHIFVNFSYWRFHSIPRGIKKDSWRRLNETAIERCCFFIFSKEKYPLQTKTAKINKSIISVYNFMIKKIKLKIIRSIHYVKCSALRVLMTHFSVQQNLTFCLFTEKYGKEKISILEYFVQWLWK